MNSFGQYFRLTTFGESHGPGIGLVLDGCPPGLSLDLEALQAELARRRPGQSALVSQRKEEDVVEILSGLFEGKTTGAPLAMLIRNQDARSKDYSQWARLFRPSHADYTYHLKYGPGRDYRGGGRSSARETACRVAAGAVAKQILRQLGLEVWAYTAEVGDLALDKPYTDLDLSLIEFNPMRCPDLDMAARMEALVRQVRKEGDSIGGVIQALVKGCPPGWGAPTFDKLHARLAYAMLSIPACKGFDYGSGFAGTRLRGSQHNDLWLPGELPAQTATNHSGGIQGGISNGMDIYFRVAFKPVATLMQDQMSIDHEGQAALYQGRGRHDPCVLPRAVPIVEAMTALVLVDAWLESRALNHPVFY